MSEPVARRESRQVKATREIAEAKRALEEIDERIAVGRRLIATGSLPYRRRLAIRASNAMLRASRLTTRQQIRLRKPDLADGPSYGERMAARSREEFELAEQHRRLGSARIAERPAGARGRAVTAVVQFAIGWVILGALIAANHFGFRALGGDYFSWYVAQGALINFAFSFISLAVVLDAYRDLISSNPLRYLGACQALVNHVMLAWRATIAGPETTNDAHAAGTWWLPALFDTLVALILFIVMVAVACAWALIVAPLQHIVYAVLGAPARNAYRNDEVSSYDPATDMVTIDAPAGSSRAGFSIGYRDKPVTLTAALAGAVFWVVSAVA